MCKGHILKANSIDDFISDFQIEEITPFDFTEEELERLEKEAHDQLCAPPDEKW